MIISGTVVRNEKYMKMCLENLRKICDKIVIVDDVSDDGTFNYLVEEARKDDRILLARLKEKSKYEIERRSVLWSFISSIADERDWIVIQDADEILSEPEKYRELILSRPSNINLIHTRLYCMWSKSHYRIDGYWNPDISLKSRTFIFKKVKYNPYNWNGTIECSEVPDYIFKLKGELSESKLLHLGYILESDRINKYKFHKEADPEGKHHLTTHIESIISEPKLASIGYELEIECYQ